ncbi:hypothetical protein N0V88_005009 [Collariella sp. IMI 366227]|nr:hypothetical protein N0V88_005009 [Collariella sp. IMI 366227]
MGFSGFLGTAGDRAHKPRATTAHTAASPPRTIFSDLALPEHISDESHLKPLHPEAPDLRELNACLDALAVVFPDIQVEVFREMFASFDGESRLALVADALLKNRVSWVKGRWRVAKDGQPAETLVSKKEKFRSPEYKQAVKTLAWHEFKGLTRSTINAVLAESNYSYLDARQTLVNLSSKSWRFTISSLFLRRKTPVSAKEAENHPLVIWRSTGRGSIIPTLKSTGNAELDHELYAALIETIHQRTRNDLEAEDRRIAAELNAVQAEELHSTIECACCYADLPFEQFTSCSTNGHMICFKCVQHSISEAIFGQGWRRSIDGDTGTLRCLAVDSDTCDGRIPQDHVHRAMMEVKNGAEVLHKLDQRLAEHSLLATGLPLIRCPFCSYAEVNDIYLPSAEQDFRPGSEFFLALIFLAFINVFIPLLLPGFLALFLLTSGIYTLRNTGESLPSHLRAELSDAAVRRRRRLRGLRFDCQNPACRRPSCLNCTKAWADVHVCHESALTALRTQVEQALSLAVKRVCPRCNTSFVKSSGCNKLACPCGYQMCYCTRCNLWETEDMDEVLRKAQEEAEHKWKEEEKRELSEQERAFLQNGWAAQPAGQAVRTSLTRGEIPKLADVFDWALEYVLR